MNRLVVSEMPRRWIFALALIGGLAMLFPALSALAGEMDANAKALVKLDEEWSKAAGTRDAEKVGAFYAEDAVAYPPNMPVAKGKAAATLIWKVMFADPTSSISWKATHAEVSKSGELGFTSGTYELSHENKVTEKGKYLCVWKKQADGSWKAFHDMWNADPK